MAVDSKGQEADGLVVADGKSNGNDLVHLTAGERS